MSMAQFQPHPQFQPQYVAIYSYYGLCPIISFIQPQQSLEVLLGVHSTPNITQVWGFNVTEELSKIDHLIWFGNFKLAALDTEFPGFIYVNPDPKYNARSGLVDYETVKKNVDCMNVLQLGITLFDDKGNLCSKKGTHTWQFNFKFDIRHDKHSPESMAFLQAHGVNLDLHNKYGINLRQFANHFMCTGLIGNPDVKFVTFQGIYDTAYIVKLICGGRELPQTELEFFAILRKYIPRICDIRHLILRFRGDFHGGLKSLAEYLNVTRIGQEHNGGSDALITGQCFFVIKKLLGKFENLAVKDSDFNGQLFGMSKSYSDIDKSAGQ